MHLYMFGEAILYGKITFFIRFAANITSVHSLLYYYSFSFFRCCLTFQLAFPRRSLEIL